ncbi:hypothetical protein GWK47_021092 [Chionoecetes opilio]|uniref:Integrase catalytic domain-containing protein n=1 Tax=Chionoecetes opilio TaxID=41210 RepID=A0A8J4XNS3_CHIOP|nr:hypothetical protein GWK47_021092 [Chionoecetes opilio]
MCGMRYARPLQPRRKPSCPPRPRSTHSSKWWLIYFNWTATPYIAVADRLSGWLEVEHLSGDATSARLITVFRRWFKRFGIPEELSCDGERTSPARNPGASSTPGVCG